MKIALTTPTMTEKGGGVSLVVETYRRELAAKGNEVAIISFDLCRQRIWEKLPGLSHFGVHQDYFPLLKSFAPEIIHVHGLWEYHSAVSHFYARKHKIPLLISPHGMLYPVALSIKKPAKKVLRKLFFDAAVQNADCIHVTCDEELKHYRELGFTNPVAVIPNCLTMPENIAALRSARDQKKRIVFLGRLHPIKNVDLMLKAWSSAAGTQDAEFILAGDGDVQYREFLQSLVRSLHLTNVFFAGFVSGEEKLRLLADSRAVVLTSKMENFGMTVLEALMVGTPALTGDHTPWRTLPLHRCGWNIPTTEADIAQAFSDILAMPGTEIQAMGDAGIRYFEDTFAADTISEKMAALYRWILKQDDKPDFVNIG